MLTEEEVQEISRVVADPRRFEILKEIAANADLACSCLRERVPITAPTLSHHLKELETCGLVTSVREGKFLRLTFNKQRWRSYVSSLNQLGR